MHLVTKTATQARKEFFELLSAAKYAGQVTVVTKNGKTAAKLIPAQARTNWNKVKQAMKKLAGSITETDASSMADSRKDLSVRDKSWEKYG